MFPVLKKLSENKDEKWVSAFFWVEIEQKSNNLNHFKNLFYVLNFLPSSN